MWFDLVPSTPTIGIRHEPWVAFGSGTEAAIDVLLSRWTTPTLEFSPGLHKVTSKKDGLTATFQPNHVMFQFQYSWRIETDAPSRPKLVYEQPAEIFSVLLRSLTEHAERALATLRSSLRVEFIGVVLQSTLDPDNLPPGASRLVGQLARPFQGRLSAYNANLTVEVGDAARCHHRMERRQDDLDEVRFNLDWQRLWSPPEAMSGAQIVSSLRKVQDNALGYFEAFDQERS